jgi:hypothetical protein
MSVGPLPPRAVRPARESCRRHAHPPSVWGIRKILLSAGASTSTAHVSRAQRTTQCDTAAMDLTAFQALRAARHLGHGVQIISRE